MKYKKIIFTCIIALIISIYLFSVRKIEVFDFKKDQVVRSSVSYNFQDNYKEEKHIFQDDEVIIKLIDKISKEKFKGKFDFKINNNVMAEDTDKYIVIRVHTNMNYYKFKIFENGSIYYRIDKEYTSKTLIDKKLKTNIWSNEKSKSLYNDLKNIINE